VTGQKRAKRAPAGRSPAPLSKTRVVAAALAVIDDHGLEAFSIRSLAQSLGVYPTALYWYVPNRNALLAEVVTLVLADVVPAEGTGDWRAWLKDLFRRYRQTVQRHPNVARLMGAQMVSNAGVDPVLPERILSTLARAGFRGDQLVHAFNSVVAAMAGFVTLEFGPAPAEHNDTWAEDFRRALRAIDARQYPVLAQTMPRLENRAFITRWQNGVEAPLDDSFEMFIDMAVKGLEQRLKAAR
jgi:TetR/AcrR family tetracycline transcriptional repressor